MNVFRASSDFSPFPPRNWTPMLFGAVIQITILFGYLMPFGTSSVLAISACILVLLPFFYKCKAIDRWALMFFLACVSLSLLALCLSLFLVSNLSEGGLRTSSYYISGAFLVLAVAQIVRGSDARLEAMSGGIIFITLIALVISFANYYTSLFVGVDFLDSLKRDGSIAQYHRSRMMGTMGNPNNFAVALIVPFSITLAGLVEKISWGRSIVFILCCVGLIFASTRGVMLGVAIVLPMAMMAAAKRRNVSRLIFLLSLPLALTVLLAFMGRDIDRVSQLIDRIIVMEGKVSIEHRFQIWSDYFGALANNPRVLILGNGLGNLLVEWPPENGYLKLVNEFGIPITLVFFGLMVVISRKLYFLKDYSSTTRIGLYSILVCMVANFSNEVSDSRSFWLAVGIAFACMRIGMSQTKLR